MFRFKKLYSVVLSLRLSVNFVHTITRHRLELESPNLHQTCILGYSQMVLNIGAIDLDRLGHFGQFWLIILGHSACPRNNSSQVWVEITKIAPNMHHAVLLAGIENGDHWPWPSRSFRPFWLWILGNLACARNNLILAGLTKFPSNMHFEILLTGIETGSHWPGPSRSFGHFESGFQETAFNVALAYWFRANGSYTPQPALVFLYRQLLKHHGHSR